MQSILEVGFLVFAVCGTVLVAIGFLVFILACVYKILEIAAYYLKQGFDFVAGIVPRKSFPFHVNASQPWQKVWIYGGIALHIAGLGYGTMAGSRWEILACFVSSIWFCLLLRRSRKEERV